MPFCFVGRSLARLQINLDDSLDCQETLEARKEQLLRSLTQPSERRRYRRSVPSFIRRIGGA